MDNSKGRNAIYQILSFLIFTVAILITTGCQREYDFEPSPSGTTTLRIISFAPDSAKIGDTITITGSGYSTVPANNIVFVNSVPAKTVFSSDSVIQIVINPGTTTGKIQLSVLGEMVVSATNLRIIDSVVLKMPWIQKADFPEKISEGLSDINGFGMTFSSATTGYIYKSNKLYAYTKATNTWQRKADLPSPKKHNLGLCFTVGNKAYIGLGGSGIGADKPSLSNAIWSYDMDTDTWTQKKDFPGNKRVTCFSFSVENLGYVGGGDSLAFGLPYLKDFWQYNPATDTWSQKADYAGAKRQGSQGFSIGENGYVIEGAYGSIAAPFTTFKTFNLWSYNPVSNSWKQQSSLNLAAGKSASSSTTMNIGNKAYTALGTNDTTLVNNVLNKKDFWEYDPLTDNWIERTQVGGPIRNFPMSFAIGGRGYVGLGTGDFVGAALLSFWEYTPE